MLLFQHLRTLLVPSIYVTVESATVSQDNITVSGVNLTIFNFLWGRIQGFWDKISPLRGLYATLRELCPKLLMALTVLDYGIASAISTYGLRLIKSTCYDVYKDVSRNRFRNSYNTLFPIAFVVIL